MIPPIKTRSSLKTLGGRFAKSPGFTLVELLVVISIISVLATLAFVNYRTAQRNSRDQKRIQELDGVKGSLELYFQNNQSYPNSDAAGNMACGSPIVSLNWGSSPFSCSSSGPVYMRVLPYDTNVQYCYVSAVAPTPATSFSLYAFMENPKNVNRTLDVAAGCPGGVEYNYLLENEK